MSQGVEKVTKTSFNFRKGFKKIKRIWYYLLFMTIVYVALKGFNPSIGEIMPTVDLICTTVVNLFEWFIHTIVGLIYHLIDGGFVKYATSILPSFAEIWSSLFKGLAGIY